MQKLDYPNLTDEQLRESCYAFMTVDQQKKFETTCDVDFSFEIPKVARFRANIFRQNRGIGAVFRCIPSKISTLYELETPPVLQEMLSASQGLILVTGATGSGKSTTLAAMVDYINRSSARHVITIEDPIEFIHESKKSLITQREVGRDTQSFSLALRAALREDPDVILIGELRDLESIRLAMTAAETGHLVLATLHTASAAKTIDRVIDVFSGDEKTLVRSVLSESLTAVISQTLVKRTRGGRIAALEVLIATPAVRHLIREGKVAQLYSVMQTNRAMGMQTLDQHLQELLKKQLIDQTQIETTRDAKERLYSC